MRTVTEPTDFARACEAARREGKRVALLPTMGALHEGHARLIDRAKEHAEFIAVSIFVNPTQFGPSEDLARYPRALAEDSALCEARGAALVFAPEAAAMYPAGDEMRVVPGPTARPLCGRFRPGHFEGVATVVTKLFGLVGPATAVFGRKDYQQRKVIERLVRDLFLPIAVVGVPTVREPDGLALSSRNRYLDESARKRALGLFLGLTAASELFTQGERRAGELVSACQRKVAAAADNIDYVEICDPDTLVPHGPTAEVGDRALLAIAARLGGARLIDNVVLGEDTLPEAQA